MAQIRKSDRIQLWLDRLNRQASSRQTVAQFCQSEKISVPSFYQWKRRLAPQVTPLPKPRKSKPAKQRGFAELVVNPVTSSAKATSAQAILPGGIVISLGTQLDVVALIVDRLLQHASPLADREAESC